MKYFVGLIAMAMLSSCAVHFGTMSTTSSKDYSQALIKGFASGQAKTVHVLGIGGLGKDALVFDAKKNMYKNHPLQSNDAYANISVDFKYSSYVFWNTSKATVAADIVTYGNSSGPKEGFSKLFNSQTECAFLKAGDQVLCPAGPTYKVAVVIDFKLGNDVVVRWHNGRKVRFKPQEVFLAQNSEAVKTDFKIDQKVVVKANGKDREGKVSGVNPTKVLVMYFIDEDVSIKPYDCSDVALPK